MAQPTVFDRILRPNVKGWRELQRALELLQGVSAEFFNNLTGDPTSYTPTWTAVTTNPRVGTADGTYTAEYFRFFRWCFVSIYIKFGTIGAAPNWSIGSGAYSWTLPITPLTDLTWTGQGLIIDDSAGDTARIITPYIDLSDNLISAWLEASPNQLGSGSPITFAANDEIIIQIGYPVEAE